MNEQIKKEAVYEANIKPLLNQIFELCRLHEIAMIANFHLGGESICVTANLGDETDAPMVMTLLGAIVTGGLGPEDVREAYSDIEIREVKA